MKFQFRRICKRFESIENMASATGLDEDLCTELRNLPDEHRKECELAIETANVQAVESVGIEHFVAKDLQGQDDNDDLVTQYRKKRLAELKEIAGKKRFGYVMELHKSDFVREVNEAGEDICGRVNEKLSELAEKFPRVKFIKAVADKIMERFPDYRLPTIFLYVNGDIYETSFGALEFGGDECTAESIEWWLASKGVLQSDLQADPSSLKCEMRKLFKTDDGRGYSSSGVDRMRKDCDFLLEEDECDHDDE